MSVDTSSDSTEVLDRRTGEIIISADSHVTEPDDLWATRLPEDMRDKVSVKPRSLFGGSKQDEKKKEEAAPKPADAAYNEDTTVDPAHRPARWAQKGLGGVMGGQDPHERIHEMEYDGVSAEVLYPSKTLSHYSLTDAKIQEAVFRVYNDWLLEYCSVSPERLVGLACISMYDVEHGIAEMERCKNAGLRGALIWMQPPAELPFSSSHYDRFWAAAQDMEMPVNLHITTGFHYLIDPKFSQGVERVRGTTNQKTMDAMNALYDFIFYGILHNHPRLKLVIVESEVGWMPFMLQQWDAYWQRHTTALGSPITRDPSDYFHEQVYATFFDDPVGAHNFSKWGVDNYMWSSDFPHRNSPWPNSLKVIERDLGHLDADDRAKVLRETVSHLYDMHLMS
jgi:predicted TIM-barrel fold metal-dependent hydrolase